MTELEIYKKAFERLRDWRDGCMKAGLHTHGILYHPDGTTEPNTMIVPYHRVKYYEMIIEELRRDLVKISLF